LIALTTFKDSFEQCKLIKIFYI